MKSIRINLLDECDDLKSYFSPFIVSEIEDMYVKVAKIKGDDIPWHAHEKEDELFLIIEGEMLMEIHKGESFALRKNDLFIVPKGVIHKVSAREECRIMLIERKTTSHTGNEECSITKSIDQQKIK